MEKGVAEFFSKDKNFKKLSVIYFIGNFSNLTTCFPVMSVWGHKALSFLYFPFVFCSSFSPSCALELNNSEPENPG